MTTLIEFRNSKNLTYLNLMYRNASNKRNPRISAHTRISAHLKCEILFNKHPSSKKRPPSNKCEPFNFENGRLFESLTEHERSLRANAVNNKSNTVISISEKSIVKKLC